MTVRELVEMLQVHDPEKPIVIDIDGATPTTIKEIVSFEDAIVLECERVK